MTNRAKGIMGIVAGVAAVGTALMLYRRKDGTTLGSHLMHSAKRLGGDFSNYAVHLKDRLLHNVKGPNGEPVYIDMYDRQFYENTEGKRVYIEND